MQKRTQLRNNLTASDRIILGASKKGRPYYFLTSLILPCPLLAVFLVLVLSKVGHSQVVVEAFAGTAWNIPSRLRVAEPGYENILFTARYNTRAWKGSPYYAVRGGIGRWGVELVHHKLYLKNPPPEIQHLEVSHGYNMLFANRALAATEHRPVVRIGIGAVIGHPEGKVRGRAIDPAASLLGGGYHLSGICLQGAIGLPFEIHRGLFWQPEAKLTAAWAKMPLLDGGSITIPNIAIHTVLGFGYRREIRRE